MKENSVFSCSPTHAGAWTRAEGWPASESGCQNLKTTADFLHPGVHLANVSQMGLEPLAAARFGDFLSAHQSRLAFRLS